MSPELKLMLMVSGSALKFHLNKTLLTTEITKKMIEAPPQHNYAPQSVNIEQLALERMKQEQLANSEILRRRTEEEHNNATKEVQTMQYLQEQQRIYEQQQKAQQQELQRFAQIKSMMEMQKKQDNTTMDSINNQISNKLDAVKNRIQSQNLSQNSSKNSQTSDDSTKKSKGSKKSKFSKYMKNAIQMEL